MKKNYLVQVILTAVMQYSAEDAQEAEDMAMNDPATPQMLADQLANENFAAIAEEAVEEE